MDNIKYIGTKIKEIRKKKQISQERLAELVAMNLRSINRIENQHNIPTLETLEKIAQVLGVSITDFFEMPTALTRKEIVDNINTMMAQMDEKELQTFYKAVYHFYH